jgi:hypothetical protein
MENYGTIWVCGNCLHHHANGECGDCHDDNHDEEPLSAIEEPFSVTMGMAWEFHSDGCINDGECDCENDSYSRSQCEGCGSWLHGERHAMTLFKNEA